jgi:hypothetical protein
LAHGTGGSAVEREASGHPEQSSKTSPRCPRVWRAGRRACSETDSGGSLPMAARSPWEESVHLTPACGEHVVSGFPEPCKPAREGSSQSTLLAHSPTLRCPVSFAGSRPRLSSLSITPQTCPVMSRRGRPTAVLQSDPLSTSPKNSTERASLASRAHCARVWFSIPANPGAMEGEGGQGAGGTN